ncbi:NAD-dependent epimerase/dehydratase family protein [Cohnella zeiphila]|uniref:NAD(P)-dependent oxidoreductase n=1 Tax=Cohnella zeiphila TaxID=2761120 RepID=A0A7X0SQH9_9BACL|nr:NAD(P)-dependent oxidoreductase [Cohnella zeiphila]MBB6733229.1 NAD(P)-dependent oxidoreductase [Cohnella zeiphila]
MKIWVTGATGKVGSRFVPRLLQRGHRVTALVRDAGRAEPLRRMGAEPVEGDLLEPGGWADTLQGADTVVHLAAQLHGGVDEATAQRANIDASVILAEAALQANVPRFVLASTNLVYGSGSRPAPGREEDELRPPFTYPRSKVAAEEALLRLYRERNLGLRILRLAFVYGEGDPHAVDYLRVMRGWHPAQRLQMIHHADVGQALLLVASAAGIDGQIYNVADDAPLTAAELFRLHGQAVPQPTEATPALDPWFMIADTTKIRDELGFRHIFPTFYTARDAGAL